MDLKHAEDELPRLSNVDFWIPWSKNIARGEFQGQRVKTFQNIYNFVTKGSPVATCRDGQFWPIWPNFGLAENQGSHSLLALKFGISS